MTIVAGWRLAVTAARAALEVAAVDNAADLAQVQFIHILQLPLSTSNHSNV